LHDGSSFSVSGVVDRLHSRKRFGGGKGANESKILCGNPAPCGVRSPLKPKSGLNGPHKALVADAESFFSQLATGKPAPQAPDPLEDIRTWTTKGRARFSPSTLRVVLFPKVAARRPPDIKIILDWFAPFPAAKRFLE